MADKINPTRKSFTEIKAKARRKRIDQRLEQYRIQHVAEDPFAAYSALLVCDDSGEPLPSWLIDVVRRGMINPAKKKRGRPERAFSEQVRWFWSRCVISVQEGQLAKQAEDNRWKIYDEEFDKALKVGRDFSEISVPEPAAGLYMDAVDLPHPIIDLFWDEKYELGGKRNWAFKIVSDALQQTNFPASVEAVEDSYHGIDKERDRLTGLPKGHKATFSLSDRVLEDHGIIGLSYSSKKYNHLADYPPKIIALSLLAKTQIEREDALAQLPPEYAIKVQNFLGE